MMATPLPNRDLLTPQEVADFLRVRLNTVYVWCVNGELPGACRIGGVWRIPRQAVLGKFQSPAPH